MVADQREDKTKSSRPKAVLVDLQLIEQDGHNPSAADLQLIRAEHLPNDILNHVADKTRTKP